MSLSIHSHTHTQSNSGKTHKPQIIIVIHFYLGVRRSFFFLYPIGFYSTPQLQGLYLLYYSCILHSCQACTYYTTHAYSTVARSVPTILLMHTPQLPGLYLYYTTHAYSTVAMSVPTSTYAYSTVAMSVPTILLNTHAFSLLSGSIQSTYSMYRGSCPTGSY